MNLNEDFIAIQGIFLSVEKGTGVLKKIKHRGGHEPTILNIITELHKFLSTKNYIKNKEINETFDEQLRDICLFLILNTELKTPLDEPELHHLINIMPQLSTCLLANVVVGLDLSSQYCKALNRFNLNITEELLLEMVLCIKKCKTRIHLRNAFEFLKVIIIKVSASSEEAVEGVEKLTDIAAQMLLNLTGLHGEQIQNVKIDSVYECMGLTFLNLLDLLLMSNEKNGLLKAIIEKILKTCCSIVMAVTIDVFCSWAEVEQDGEVLQTLIGEKSYRFIEKYQKYQLAKELIGMLGTIAQKPKSVDERIQKANPLEMIRMINKADANQKQWFMALLNTQVLRCKDSVECIDKWAHLCTLGDVSRLLNMSILINDSSAKKVVIKCASTLDFGDLVLATTRHFHQNGIKNNLNANVQQPLILLFNKIKDRSISDEFSKELYLLLLQNFQQTLAFIIAECLKNTFYSSSLLSVWPHIKEIIAIDDVGINILNNEIKNCLPNEHNCKNYVELFNILIETQVFSTETFTLKIFLPFLQNSSNEENYEILKHTLEILKDLQGNVPLKSETECFFNFLLDSMKNYRCNFLNFNGTKQEITRLIVEIIEKYCEANKNLSHSAHMIKSDEFFTSYYREKLFNHSSQTDMLKTFFPINFENHAETVAHLIKILPLCVTLEWTMIFSKLVETLGLEKTIELACDAMVLLCELVNSQETKSDQVNCMNNALKCCLQNLGVTVKECIQPRINNLHEDVTLTRNICRLLKEIPSGDLKSEEGLPLASLLSVASLRSLRPNKKFACLLASINEPHICKMLAEKILS